MNGGPRGYQLVTWNSITTQSWIYELVTDKIGLEIESSYPDIL